MVLVTPPSLPKRVTPASQKEVEGTPNSKGKTDEAATLLLSELTPLVTSMDYNAIVLLLFEAVSDVDDNLEENKKSL